MLQIKNLTIYKETKPILRDFSFTPQPGEKTALIGEEGSGKSTLLALIHDPSLVCSYVSYTGSVAHGGTVTGYLPQVMPESISHMTFWEYLYSLGDSVDYGEAARLAEKFSLPDRILDELVTLGGMSGGERVKVQLLGLLLSGADMLLLDEPTNDLDIDTIRWMEDFIKNTDKTVMYISHDEELLENTADCIIHFEQIMRRTEPKYTIARTGYTDYMERRGNAIEKSAAVEEAERSAFDAKMERYRKIYDRVRVEQRDITRRDPSGGRLLKKKMHTVKSMERRFERERENLPRHIDSEEAIMIDFPKLEVPHGKTILRLELPELCAGDVCLARDIKLVVMGGDSVVITGQNGSGKTTLIREIVAALASRRDIRTAYMPQNYDELLPMDKSAVMYLTDSGDRSEEIRNRTYLGSIKFTPDEMDAPAAALSGGQRAKLFFIKMILSGAELLVLDEPTRNLSPLSAPVIRRILADYGGTIIAVSHDRRYISEVADRVLRLTPRGLYEE